MSDSAMDDSNHPIDEVTDPSDSPLHATASIMFDGQQNVFLVRFL